MGRQINLDNGVYITPTPPKKYWFNCLRFKCTKCEKKFHITFPNGNEIIQFREIEGADVRWWHTYGKHGYLELATVLIPEHSLNDEITWKKSKAFIRELNKHCECGKTGNGFEFALTSYECTSCHSKDIECLEEKILVNPKLQWLKISSKLVQYGCSDSMMIGDCDG